jgi:hypothetical protein
MTYPIIKTENYLLIVDDSEIKVGDTIYYTIYGEDENEVTDTEPFRIGVDVVRDINVLGNLEFEMESLIALPKECKKIISHLPLNNSPILESVDLLPPLEDDENVEQIAEDDWDIYGEQYKNTPIWDYREIYVAGYNKAKEKYKYTEKEYNKIKCILDDIQEDLADYQNEIGIGMMDHNQWQQLFIDRVISSITSYEDLSLQQPKMPVGFECEMVYRVKSGTIQEHKEGKAGYEYYEPKITITPQGQTVWGGTYKYE